MIVGIIGSTDTDTSAQPSEPPSTCVGFVSTVVPTPMSSFGPEPPIVIDVIEMPPVSELSSSDGADCWPHAATTTDISTNPLRTIPMHRV